MLRFITSDVVYKAVDSSGTRLLLSELKMDPVNINDDCQSISPVQKSNNNNNNNNNKSKTHIYGIHVRIAHIHI